MRVERYNYRAQFGDVPDPLFAEIREMLLQGRYILSAEVRRFEEEFGDYLGIPHVRGVNSGTDALTISLLALGIGRGDEVITQANTFYATVAAIRLVGATPVLVDADEDTFLINEDQVEAAITSRTRVILPVHLYGKPLRMKKLLRIAQRHGLAIVEDAAQAHGARVDGWFAGTRGDLGCFSFHPSKNLAAAGDGGAIVTHSQDLAERVRRLRELGQRGQNNHVVLGCNSKLDAVQARILSWKLPFLDEWNKARRRVAQFYRERLEDLPIVFQATDPEEEHVYHLFQIRTLFRDRFLETLQENGIDAVVRYPTPIHLQPAFVDSGWRPGQFPVAERLARELLCLPIRPDLTLDEIDYVCECVRGFFTDLNNEDFNVSFRVVM
ncbi:MAG: DegT/DnrJ/EryC1/StrS family aminotransferase [Acidobacteria bacterium]|nr:DegT/DnrJ/EryC1/StrS family aminotransferase [Acidobacteriota bacterium]